MEKTDTTNPGKKFRYQEMLDRLTVPCPPLDFGERETVAYRWVFDTMEDERNFLPQYVKNPKRFDVKEESQKCLAIGLSFFDTEENAQKRYKQLKGFFSKKATGKHETNIAGGNLKPDFGVCDIPNKEGHFTFYTYENVDLGKISS